jgi:4'-phosphopantetheinyl transferase
MRGSRAQLGGVELRLEGDLGSVRLWRVALDVDAAEEARHREGLAADELARAEGFSGEAARRRYVAARGALRALLGELLGEPPGSVRIEAGPSGKPRLAGSGRTGIHFNVSHSGDLALICVADREVGVDLESVRPVPDAVAIARRRFAPEEASFVEQANAGASGGQRSEVDRRFLLCWTRKEALVKALGAGLDFDLRSFTVPLEPAGGVVELGARSGGEPQRWLLTDVPLGDAHVGALAIPAPATDGGVDSTASPQTLADLDWK